MKTNICLSAGLLFYIILTNSCTTTSPLNERASNELLTILKTQPEFIKVHAAEYLIWLGHTDEPRKEFLHENELHGDEPKYRIGIWRVLAQTEKNNEGKMKWGRKVLDTFGDMNGSDRLHASETLAKLEISPLKKYPEATQLSLQDESRNLQVYTLWAASYSSEEAMNKNRKQFLSYALADSNKVIRSISAYIMRKIKGLTAADWNKLAKQALTEQLEPDLRTTMLNTAFVTYSGDTADAKLYEKVKSEILQGAEQFSAQQRIELAQVLAEKGTKDNLPLLEDMLNNVNSIGIYEAESKEGADVRAAAAYAILKINK